MEIYIVQAGDTVYSIAKKYGVSPQRIITDNGIINTSGLAVGQALLILIPETVHTVRSGETLASIAGRYGTSVLEILRNNPHLSEQAYLPAGESIVIRYALQKNRGVKLSGFAYSHIRPRVLSQVLPYLTYLIIFGYGFNEDGSIITLNDERVIDAAHSYKTAVLLSLSLIDNEGHFSTEKLTPLLTDASFRGRVINGMIQTIRQKGAQGMDIDMEYIPAQYKSEFAAFVAEAGEKLRAEGYILNIDLAPKTSASQAGTLYEAHNYASLGASSDLAFLMTYEWGYQFGPPLAIAPIRNVTAVLDYALTEIPAGRIYLGYPNYAYDWPLPFIQGQTHAQVIGDLSAVYRAAEYGAHIMFEETTQSPYYNYTAANGVEHIVRFEDVRSLREKFALAGSRGIAGCGCWNLMRSFPQSYLLLNGMYDIEKIYNE